jgi:hypothetical protein
MKHFWFRFFVLVMVILASGILKFQVIDGGKADWLLTKLAPNLSVVDLAISAVCFIFVALAIYVATVNWQNGTRNAIGMVLVSVNIYSWIIWRITENEASYAWLTGLIILTCMIFNAAEGLHIIIKPGAE